MSKPLPQRSDILVCPICRPIRAVVWSGEGHHARCFNGHAEVDMNRFIPARRGGGRGLIPAEDPEGLLTALREARDLTDNVIEALAEESS